MDYIIAPSSSSHDLAFEDGYLQDCIISPSDYPSYTHALMMLPKDPFSKDGPSYPLIYIHAFSGSITNYGTIPGIAITAGSVTKSHGIRDMTNLAANFPPDVAYWYSSKLAEKVSPLPEVVGPTAPVINPNFTDASGGATIQAGSYGTIFHMPNENYKQIDKTALSHVFDFSISASGVITVQRAIKYNYVISVIVDDIVETRSGKAYSLYTLTTEPQEFLPGWNDVGFIFSGTQVGVRLNGEYVEIKGLDELEESSDEGDVALSLTEHRWAPFPVPQMVPGEIIIDHLGRRHQGEPVLQPGSRMFIGPWVGEAAVVAFWPSANENLSQVFQIPLKGTWVSPDITFPNKRVLDRVEIAGIFLHEHNCTIAIEGSDSLDWSYTREARITLPFQDNRVLEHRNWTYMPIPSFLTGTHWRFAIGLSTQSVSSRLPRRLSQLCAVKLSFRDV